MIDHCKHCGTEFARDYSHGTVQVFCSRACYLQAKAKPFDTCPICQKQFPRKTSKNGNQLCCGRACAQKAKAQNQQTQACKTCGKEYLKHWGKRNPDYCSVECTPRLPCPCCGEIIVGRKTNKSTNALRFCSRQCSIYYYKVLSSDSNYTIRGFVTTMKRLGKLQCERCEESDLPCLEVHHKNRDRADNSFENLETLCHNCHGLEHGKVHQTAEADYEGERKKRIRDIRVAEFVFANKIELSHQ